jgi:hypothetical protein
MLNFLQKQCIVHTVRGEYKYYTAKTINVIVNSVGCLVIIFKGFWALSLCGNIYEWVCCYYSCHGMVIICC